MHLKTGPQAVCGLFIYLLCGVGPSIAAAEGAPSAAACGAVFVDRPPRIDGALDDPAWEQASKFGDFVHSYFGTPAPMRTIAYLCYDNRNLYAAFRCEDPNPHL